MSDASSHSVTIDLASLKRLVTAAGLAGSASREDAERKAEADVDTWRTVGGGAVERVDVNIEVLAQIAEAASLAIAGLGPADAVWAEEVRADLAQVSAAFHGLPPARDPGR